MRWWRSSRERQGGDAGADRVGSVAYRRAMSMHGKMDSRLEIDPPRWGSRQEAAIAAEKAVLAMAEENYLAEPGLSLGIWLARVEETLAVAARAVLAHIDHGCLLIEEDVAIMQAGLFADVSAEAIRAVVRLCGEQPRPEVKEKILELVATCDPLPPRPGWDELQEALLRCQAALEPIANGLRNGDLPMEAAIDREGAVSNSLLEVARHGFAVVYALCS